MNQDDTTRSRERKLMELVDKIVELVESAPKAERPILIRLARNEADCYRWLRGYPVG